MATCTVHGRTLPEGAQKPSFWLSNKAFLYHVSRGKVCPFRQEKSQVAPSGSFEQRNTVGIIMRPCKSRAMTSNSNCKLV